MRIKWDNFTKAHYNEVVIISVSVHLKIIQENHFTDSIIIYLSKYTDLNLNV